MLHKLINNVDEFTEAERKILEYLLSHESEILSLTSHQLAELTYSSPASITRLCKKIGFSGFNELKFYLNQKKSAPSDPMPQISWSSLTEDIKQTLNFVEEYDFSHLNDLIHQSHRVYVFGTSFGERNALEMFRRNFLALGIHMIDIPSITELKWILNESKLGDLLFVISYSGQNAELLQLVKSFKLKQISVISVTPMKNNDLSMYSSEALYYSETELDRSNLILEAEFNLFTTLHILLDAIFRKYVDYLKLNQS